MPDVDISQPELAVDPNNLLLVRGNAGTAGTSHNVAQFGRGEARREAYALAQQLGGRPNSNPAAPAPAPTGASDTPIVGKGDLAGAAVESEAASPGLLARTTAGISEYGPKIAKFAGVVFTVVGAGKEAQETEALKRRLNPGAAGEFIDGFGTFVIGIAAGGVDDALGSAEIALLGAPVTVQNSYESYGSGPTQHLAGEAIRGLLRYFH